MSTVIHKAKESFVNKNLIILGNSSSNWSQFGFTDQEMNFIHSEFLQKESSIELNKFSGRVFIESFAKEEELYKLLERSRERGSKLIKKLNSYRVEEVEIVSLLDTDLSKCFAEGMALSNYQFLKYFTVKKKNALNKIYIHAEDSVITNLNAIIKGATYARDLVNEPLSYLTAIQFSKDIARIGEKAGFHTEVLHKKQIETLKMGGLLSVNKGATEPPTFNVLNYKPKNHVNTNPIVLVGKGIVYDTGGLSLKSTLNSMDIMKCDMAGGATVVGAIYAVAKSSLPIHVIGLIPATENRPGGNAYAPGDVIHMMNGTSVEVLNTDAEGRLVLADALSYAKKYDPELVIDIATLTGAAYRAIGKYGIVAMGNVAPCIQQELSDCGDATYERLAIMPFWDEYADLLKSDIADIKNIGSTQAGHISAGKFLEHFTDYPWMHFDIAGPAFLSEDDYYRLKGGTAIGVRILFEYLIRKSNQD